MKKAVITGVTGMDGSYMADILLEKGYEVHGILRRNSSEGNRERIRHLEDKIDLHFGDLTDSSSLRRILEGVRPDEIYNLGAMSHVRVSFECPESTAEITGVGVLRLLEAVRDIKLFPRVYQAGSSEMYGKVVEIPQNEKTPFYPRSPYGCAKLFGCWIARNYREAYGIHVCQGILFNHEGPRRGEGFVTRKITKALARIISGKQDCIYLGNVDAKRDWGYARDYMEAAHAMLQKETPDDYVVATGETHSVREFLEIAFGLVDLDWKEYVKIDPSLYRPSEVDILLGDSSKAQLELGWKPKIYFRELIEMMVLADGLKEGLTRGRFPKISDKIKAMPVETM